MLLRTFFTLYKPIIPIYKLKISEYWNICISNFTIRFKKRFIAYILEFEEKDCQAPFFSLLSSKCAPKPATHPFILIFEVLRPSCLVVAKPCRPHHLTCGMRAINKSPATSPVWPGNFGAALSRQESISLYRGSGSSSQESIMQNNTLTCTCSICQQEVPGIIITRVYSKEGIPACPSCYDKIQQSKLKPYSKLMDKLAILETGYHLNRKQANISRSLNAWKGAC
jgi:hypothetical protein